MDHRLLAAAVTVIILIVAAFYFGKATGRQSPPGKSEAPEERLPSGLTPDGQDFGWTFEQKTLGETFAPEVSPEELLDQHMASEATAAYYPGREGNPEDYMHMVKRGNTIPGPRITSRLATSWDVGPSSLDVS